MRTAHHLIFYNNNQQPLAIDLLGRDQGAEQTFPFPKLERDNKCSNYLLTLKRGSKPRLLILHRRGTKLVMLENMSAL